MNDHIRLLDMAEDLTWTVHSASTELKVISLSRSDQSSYANDNCLLPVEELDNRQGGVGTDRTLNILT
jgi:hypothetical protein